MDLLADIHANLPTMQAEAERLMVDTVEFRANDGGTVFDPNTGDYVETPGTLIYSGKCQVQISDVLPRSATVGDQQVAIERTFIKIPAAAPPIPVNSVGTITDVAAISSTPIGARYRVTGTHDKTYQTASRIPCEMVSP